MPWDTIFKYSFITAYMCDVLHWLRVSQRIQYHITAMVSRCAPRTFMTSAAQCGSLRFAARGELWSPGLRFAARGELWSPGPVSYYAAKGLFGCGSISME